MQTLSDLDIVYITPLHTNTENVQLGHFLPGHWQIGTSAVLPMYAARG